MKVGSTRNHLTGSVSKALVIDSIWQQPDAISDIARITYSACVHPMKPIDKLFIREFGDTSKQHNAVRYYPGEALSGASWHHGSHYALSVKGTAAAVLEHCRLTQTEREHLLLEAARRSMHSREVVAVATSTLQAMPQRLELVRSLDFVGFIIVKPATA